MSSKPIALFTIMLLLGCASLVRSSAAAEIYFRENFKDLSKWIQSESKKESGEAGKLILATGEQYGDKDSTGAQTSEDARFYQYTAEFDKKFSNMKKDLVIQFSVKHEQGIDCGGGYLKLLPCGVDPKKFNDKSPYNIMFGPDICGHTTKKVHVIFNNGKENVMIKKEIPAPDDKLTHTYTLIVRKDSTYEVRIDGDKKEGGNMYEDFDFELPKKIKDPKQFKPKDWVDESEIDDPADKKPSDWDDEPEKIADPDAKKPEDWSDEDDGDWEAPTIKNPKYKGEWKPRRIPNPDYKGEQVHPEIDNPDWKHIENVGMYDEFCYVAFDLQQVKSGSIFYNIMISDSEAECDKMLNGLKPIYAKEKEMHDRIQKEREAKEKAKMEEEEKARKAEEASKRKDEGEGEEDLPEEDEGAEDELDKKEAEEKEEL